MVTIKITDEKEFDNVEEYIEAVVEDGGIIRCDPSHAGKDVFVIIEMQDPRERMRRKNG